MVKTIAERLADLEQAHGEVDDIVLGRWNFETGKRHAGIAERLDSLTEQVKLIVKLLKWGIAPLVGVCALTSLGESFKDLVPSVVKVLIAVIGLH